MHSQGKWLAGAESVAIAWHRSLCDVTRALYTQLVLRAALYTGHTPHTHTHTHKSHAEREREREREREIERERHTHVTSHDLSMTAKQPNTLTQSQEQRSIATTARPQRRNFRGCSSLLWSAQSATQREPPAAPPSHAHPQQTGTAFVMPDSTTSKHAYETRTSGHAYLMRGGRA